MGTDILRRLGIRSADLLFQFSRSSGPGGQNVNKVNSRVTLRFRVGGSALPPGVAARLRASFATRITADDELLLSSDRYRDQGRNKEDVLERFAALLERVARPPKKRRPTKPGRAAKERRLTDKKKRSERKSSRGYRSDG